MSPPFGVTPFTPLSSYSTLSATGYTRFPSKLPFITLNSLSLRFPCLNKTGNTSAQP